MKYSLVFVIYNKEKWVKSLIDSWLNNCSDLSRIEVIFVFDALNDKSHDIIVENMKNYSVSYQTYFANDKHEIFCNNLGLSKSSGEYVIFIQDDNWIYDKNWDLILDKIYSIKEINVGAVALLAGAKILPTSFYYDFLIRNYLILRYNLRELAKLRFNFLRFGFGFTLERMETDTPHKKENFSNFKISSLERAIWTTHLITRPFCVNRLLLNKYKGLDKKFMPHWGDDIDLSIKLILDGYRNVYYPFDLVNISTVTDSEKHGKLNYIVQKRVTQLYKRYKNRLKSIYNEGPYIIKKL